MSKLNKKTIKHSIIAGGIFATGIALLDFLGQTAFNFWKYIFNFVFMGISLGVFVIKPSLKNHMNKSKQEDSSSS
ncbi:MAG: hypothetical protein LAT51_06525 [Flavobacteriaceae bacterium]|nr:hypothetical protein [Flavobacteriaceae bacterium]